MQQWKTLTAVSQPIIFNTKILDSVDFYLIIFFLIDLVLKFNNCNNQVLSSALKFNLFLKLCEKYLIYIWNTPANWDKSIWINKVLAINQLFWTEFTEVNNYCLKCMITSMAQLKHLSNYSSYYIEIKLWLELK